MSVVHVGSTEEFNKVLKDSGKLVVVDYSATWCGPCKKIAPLYEELAKELGDEVVLAHVDIDDLADLEEVSSVRGVPTFRLYKSGSKVAEVVGANLDKVKAEIASHK